MFFAQNNLSFLALQHMSNSAFQLLLNMRIVAVALLTVHSPRVAATEDFQSRAPRRDGRLSEEARGRRRANARVGLE